MVVREENNRNVAVMVYSFTIHGAVLKKQLSVGSMWSWVEIKYKTTNNNKTINFIENWKIINYITFPPANSL